MFRDQGKKCPNLTHSVTRHVGLHVILQRIGPEVSKRNLDSRVTVALRQRLTDYICPYLEW